MPPPRPSRANLLSETGTGHSGPAALSFRLRSFRPYLLHAIANIIPGDITNGSHLSRKRTSQDGIDRHEILALLAYALEKREREEKKKWSTF